MLVTNNRRRVDDLNSSSESSRVEPRKNKYVNLSLRNYILAMEESYNKKNLIPLYLIEMMDRENRIYKTLSDLAEELDYPKTTLSSMFSEFKKRDFLKRVRNGVYMINPSVAYRGNAADREELIGQYMRIG